MVAVAVARYYQHQLLLKAHKIALDLPLQITFVAGAGGGDEAAASFFASCFLKREAISPFLFIVQLLYRVQTKYESAIM